MSKTSLKDCFKRAMKTQWMVQEVTPMNFHYDKKLLILFTDRNQNWT